MRDMNVKKFIPLLLLGMMLTFFSSGLWSQNLEIHYINVQQGQSTLIIGPDGTTILYDGGYEFKGTTEVVPYLQALGITTSQSLDYIITSHLHTDHYVGLTETMNYGYDALHVYDNGSNYSNTYVDAFYAAAAGTSAGGVTAMTLGQVINLGSGATATCVAVDGSVIGVGAVPDGQANENDRSICLLIEYGDFDYLVTGDAGGGSDDYACTGRSTSQVNIETPLVQAIMPGGAYPLLNAYGVEIAHVGHHASESSGNSDYMNLLTPSVACISVGDGQSTDWYHPREDVVNVFLAIPACVTAPAALVLQTEEGNPSGSITSFDGYCVGDIVITTDGVSSYTVSASGAVSQGPDERGAAGLPQTILLDEYTGGDPAPVIFNVNEENVTLTSADIVWTTNENADSLVRYGTASGSYTQTVSDSGMVLSHTLSLSGLTEAVTYYYQVESTDSGSNTTTSMEYSFSTGSTGGDSGVVFSEVYYDTVGTDADEEWMELYNNTASTVDIGGWTITDNNGAGASYTFPAGTTIAAGTYLTVAADSTGFNGLYGYDADLYGTLPALNNDGDTLILTNGSSETVDFVAWEGGAAAGIPAGWGSTTEPVVSTGSTIVRSDPAVDTDTYTDWGSASGNGNPQTQVSIPPTADIVFSEVYYDTVGTDADEEWIELYNNTASTVDIGGWTITDNNGTGASYTFPADTTIAAGTYFTVAANSAGFNALYGYDADLYGTLPFLNNDGDTLILTDGSSETVDFVAWEGGAAAGIPAGWGSTTAPVVSTGSTIVRTDPAVDTDTYTDWGTASNNGNPQTQASIPPTTDVVFSEIYYDTVGTDADEEWIELYNNTASTVDIGGWIITDNNGTGSSYTFPAGTTIAAGTYFTVAHNSAGFYALYGYDADLYGVIPLLNNDGDTLLLTDGSAVEVDAVAWEGGATSGIPTGWGSTSAPSAATGNTIVRTDPAVDSDTYVDWTTAPNNGNPQTQGGTPPDTTPPVISNVRDTSVTTNGAVIEWDTDEDSDSVVEYGTASGTYTDSASDGSMVTAHTVSLSGLSPDTTYYYIVKSTDAANNTGISPEYTVTTDPDVTAVMINTISLTTNTKNRKTTATAEIVVTSGGSPVEGALVAITWSGSVSGTAQATTDSSGKATFKSARFSGTPWTFTVTVNNITKTDYTWDSSSSELTKTVSD